MESENRVVNPFVNVQPQETQTYEDMEGVELQQVVEHRPNHLRVKKATAEDETDGAIQNFAVLAPHAFLTCQ